MQIHSIEALSTNYIWIMEDGQGAVVVDPGEAEGVLQYLKDHSFKLKAILLTHNHSDHIDGVKEISAEYSDAPIYGPKETADLADHVVQDGDSFELFGKSVQVFKTAGHSEEHISFLIGKDIFCGDALFSGGCGRVFTGDYETAYTSIQFFNQLDEDVSIYAGHEYTQTNLEFANSIEPENETITQALKHVKEMRANGLPTYPSTIGKEKQINLFLQAATLEKFTELRNQRDDF